MESSGPHIVKRRAPLSLSGNTVLPAKITSDGSPSPFASNVTTLQNGETRTPRSTQTVSVGWEEGEDGPSQHTSRLHIELAECVETKTVTTTTTTKRSYPPLRVRQRPLASLDSKEYPLALRATPSELVGLSFEFDGEPMELQEDDRHTPLQEVGYLASLIRCLPDVMQCANYLEQRPRDSNPYDAHPPVPISKTRTSLMGNRPIGLLISTNQRANEQNESIKTEICQTVEKYQEDPRLYKSLLGL
jgi:hypothetical protein